MWAQPGSGAHLTPGGEVAGLVRIRVLLPSTSLVFETETVIACQVDVIPEREE